MHIFISYVKEDAEIVAKIVDYLKSYDIEVWLDKNSLLPGQRFKNVIRKAIQSGNHFIACFSDNYLKRTKTYMNEELYTAIAELRQRPMERTWFIPVLLSDCEIPDIEISPTETLHSIQWVALYKDFEQGMKQIIKVILPLNNENIVNSLLKDIQLGDKDVMLLSIKKLSKMKEFSDKRVIERLVEIYYSRINLPNLKYPNIENSEDSNLYYTKTISEIIWLAERGSRKYVVQKLIELMTGEKPPVNYIPITELACICSPQSIIGVVPDFVENYKKIDKEFPLDKYYVPYYAWPLKYETFVRIKHLFYKRKGTVGHYFLGLKDLDFETEIKHIKWCPVCQKYEGICIEAESYTDSGEVGYIDRYECALCGYIWTEDNPI